MKKILSILMIAILLLTLGACSSARGQAEPTAEPTAEPQTGDALAAPLTALLDEIRTSYYPGTSGSSLTGAAEAAALCDLFTAASAAAGDVRSICEFYLGTLPDSTARAEFAQQFLGVCGSYESLRDFGTDVLETAGYTPVAAPWSYEAMTPLFDAAKQGVSIGFYAPILDRYRDALAAGLSREDMIAADLNYMTCDSGADGVGYTLRDVNGDGIPELLLCAIAGPENAFLYGMVFELYSVDMFGFSRRVFSAGERDRYYLTGEALFAHEGSSGAADSFADTEIFDGESMSVTGGASQERVMPALTPISEW